MKINKVHIPASVMKRYSVISEKKFLYKDAGQCAALRDDKVLKWFNTKQEAIEHIRKLAKKEAGL